MEAESVGRDGPQGRGRLAACENAEVATADFEAHDGGQPTATRREDRRDTGTKFQLTPERAEALTEKVTALAEAFRSAEGRYPGRDDAQFWSAVKKLTAELLGQPGGSERAIVNRGESSVEKAVFWAADQDVIADLSEVFDLGAAFGRVQPGVLHRG